MIMLLERVDFCNLKEKLDFYFWMLKIIFNILFIFQEQLNENCSKWLNEIFRRRRLQKFGSVSVEDSVHNVADYRHVQCLPKSTHHLELFFNIGFK